MSTYGCIVAFNRWAINASRGKYKQFPAICNRLEMGCGGSVWLGRQVPVSRARSREKHYGSWSGYKTCNYWQYLHSFGQNPAYYT